MEKEWFAVEYSGYWSIQDSPNYDEGNDLLDAEQVGKEAAEANAKLAASAPSLQSRLTAAEAERDSLKDWKESAMNVMPDFQEIGKLLNVSLGRNVSPQIIPKIKQLTARAEEAESVQRETKALNDSYAAKILRQNKWIKGLKSEIKRLIEQQLDVSWEVECDKMGLDEETQDHIKLMADDVIQAVNDDAKYVKDLEAKLEEAERQRDEAKCDSSLIKQLQEERRKDQATIQRLTGTLHSICHEPYPTKAFPPIEPETWNDIHETIKEKFNIPIDRLSAEYGRLLTKPLKDEAKAALAP